MMEQKQMLKNFILAELLNGQNLVSLDDDEDLLISGLIDSLGVVRLINFIEQSLEMSIPPEDVTLENFQTVGCISKYLSQFSPMPLNMDKAEPKLS
jgi:acyl carrier protein